MAIIKIVIPNVKGDSIIIENTDIDIKIVIIIIDNIYIKENCTLS